MNGVETIRLSMIFGSDRMRREFHINDHFASKQCLISRTPHCPHIKYQESLSPTLLPGCQAARLPYHFNLVNTGLGSLGDFIVHRKLGSIYPGSQCPRDIQHLATVSRLTWSSCQSYLTFNIASHKLEQSLVLSCSILG